MEFGAFVVGATLGTIPDGGKYKVMSLVGHGAKAVETYHFGPDQIVADGWSDGPQVYQPVADALNLLAKSEKVTWPGRPRNGTVAILLPQASQPWDGSSQMKYYMSELYGLHAALVHAQYPVDFVDDIDLEAGKLKTYGYATLYITAPNLSVKAQTAIAEWVKAGGTLVLSPGACMADEYNEPATTLTALLGASWGAVKREDMPTYGYDNFPHAKIVVSDAARLGASEDQTIFLFAGLTPDGGKSLATLPDGKSALVEQTCGNGHIFAFGYWPGASYWYGADRFEKNKLPQDWSAATRDIITTPARLAKAKKHVTISEPLVEGALLESDKGIAVTLFNWKYRSLPPLTVTLSINDMPDTVKTKLRAASDGKKLKVESAEKGSLTYTVDGDKLTVTLPLKTVDVLMISW